MSTILAVDDSAYIRQLLVSTLSGYGYDVLPAEDGEKALQLAREKKIDLVLSDITMPRMDGIALLRELRALPQHRLTPILMLTTEAGAEKKAQGIAAGATGWVLKPFNPDLLAATINKVIHKH